MSDSEPDQALKPAKRQRIDALDDADPPALDADADSDEEQTSIELDRAASAEIDSFVAGSIVRVSMKDFFSYDSVEFRPGPRLYIARSVLTHQRSNFVIGPNGTGKSTILSAIALALNFPASVVDRSKELKDLVKRDSKADKAIIEIELKNELGKPNITISRAIHRHDNRSEFKIDGEVQPAKRVSDIVAALHIQVDNICVFMPQEKVRELANKTPAQLLRETEKAAGGPELHALHEKLIDIKRNEATLAKRVEEQKSNLASKEDRLSAMQRDLERFRERAEIEDQLTLLSVHVPWARYREAKAVFDEVKARRSELKARLDEAKEGDQPLLDLQAALVDDIKKLERQRNACTDKHVAASGKLANSATQLSRHESSSESEKTTMSLIRESEDKRLSAIEKHEMQIRDLERKYQLGPPAPFDRSEEQRIAREIDRMRDRLLALQEQQTAVAGQYEARQQELQSVQRLTDRLNSVTAQRERALNSESGGPDILKAVQWIRQNRDKLRGKVFEPIQLLVGCKDARYAAHLEACINQATMRTILCANEDDYRLLSEELTGRQRLRLNMATLTSEHRFDPSQVPYSRAELNAVGFECWALDQIIAPEEVVGFLCKASNIHRVPMTCRADAKIDSKRFERPDAGIRRYLTHDSITTIGYSSYGEKAAFEHSSFLRPSRVFVQSVDRMALQNAEREATLCREECQKLQMQLSELAQQEQQIRQAHEPLKMASTEQKELRKAVESKFKEFNQVKSQLETTRKRLANERAKPSGAEQRAQCKAKLRSLARDHVKLVAAHRKILIELSEHLIEGTKIAFELAQAAANRKALDEVVAERLEAHQALEREHDKARQDATKTRAAAVQIHDQAESLQEKLTPELEARFSAELPAIRALRVEDVEERLADAEKRLADAPSVSSAVQASYVNLQKQVEAINAELAKQETTLEKMRKKLEKHRGRYEPAIDRLIESISRNFSRCFDEMSLLGEVGIDKPEDFADWGIIIRVSFRRDIEMQRLTAQRQSGGERALSTVVYFMSLMRQAKTPFTVVDEINQGMDQRNERAMHDQLVKTTCQDDAGQAWLVTPKLLTGLSYHPHMRVLAIGNGPWIPSSTDAAPFPMREMLQRRKRNRDG